MAHHSKFDPLVGLSTFGERKLFVTAREEVFPSELMRLHIQEKAYTNNYSQTYFSSGERNRGIGVLPIDAKANSPQRNTKCGRAT